MKSSKQLTEGTYASGGLKVSSNVYGLIEPLSLWCLEYPEYFGTFGRDSNCLSTVTNIRLYEMYCSREGKDNLRGNFPKRSLINFFGIPLDLALKQAKLTGFVRVDGSARKSSNSSKVSSSQSHLPKIKFSNDVSLPEEMTNNLSAVAFSRSVDTVILKVKNPPRLGKFSLFPDAIPNFSLS